MQDNGYDPQCDVCGGYLFGPVDPCECMIHKPEQIAAALRHVAYTMQMMAAIMQACGGFGNSATGKVLLLHAAEMQGAAEMCIEWASKLEAE